MLRSSIVKSWSSTQKVTALSSAEAELYAICKMATQLLSILSIARDFRLDLKGEVYTDSTAAMGVAYRQGLGGKARHIKVQYLWIQESIRDKEFGLFKVGTELNPADILTKHVPSEILMRHTKAMGYSSMSGRANISSNLLCVSVLNVVSEGGFGSPRTESHIRSRDAHLRAQSHFGIHLNAQKHQQPSLRFSWTPWWASTKS